MARLAIVPTTFVMAVLLALAPRAARSAGDKDAKAKEPPKIKFYKGPADGKTIALHLQGGFTGEPIEILFNDMPLFQGEPKTRPTLGLAAVVKFTIGKEETGKLTLRTKMEPSSATFTWSKGGFILVNIIRAKVQWAQADKAPAYD
ncbi:MAG: hypothetical protein U0793_11495 [Gemmataceae bacterium]